MSETDQVRLTMDNRDARFTPSSPLRPYFDQHGFPIIDEGERYRIVRSPYWPHEYRVVWIATNLYRWALTLRGARRIRARLERRHP